MTHDHPISKQLARALWCALAMGSPAHAAAGGKIADSAALEAAVLGLIGDAGCTSHEQCRTVAVGAKACGGPEAYLAWSTLRTNEVALKEAAEAFSVSRRRDVERSGAVSNCSLLADPGAYCASGAGSVGGAERTSAGPTNPSNSCRLNKKGGGAR